MLAEDLRPEFFFDFFSKTRRSVESQLSVETRQVL
jgi:hypothetical protein